MFYLLFLDISVLINWSILVFVVLRNYPALLCVSECFSPREAENLSLYPTWASNSSGVHLQRCTNIFSNLANKNWIDWTFLKMWAGSIVVVLWFVVAVFLSWFLFLFFFFVLQTTCFFSAYNSSFLFLWKITCPSPGNFRTYARSSFFKDLSIQEFSSGYCSPLMCVVLSAKK